MDSIEVKIQKGAKGQKDKLVISIPMQEPTPSSTGKSLTVASTRGNMKTDVEVNGKPLTIGVNAYISSR